MTKLLAILVGLVFITTPLRAQIVFSEDTVPEFEQIQSEELVLEQLVQPNGSGVDQLLINGSVIDPRFFPGVLRMVKGGTCTASLVGPSTILFAAHCLLGNSRISFRSGNRTVRGVCTSSPGYNPNTHHEDWALCLLERRVSGIAFETIDISSKPSVGDRLMLSGYGCTSRGGPLDDRLRVGFSDVVGQPSWLRREPSAIFTQSAIGEGEAVLCPGDSGGPIFRSGDDASGSRQIVGVNSRTTYGRGVSIFSATASPEGAAFIRSWAERYNQQICGVNRQSGCK